MDVIDIEIFQDLHQNLAEQPDTLVDIYRKFLLNAATLIHALRGQDNEERDRTLHMLKGTAAMLGANRMASAAASLQDKFRQSPATDGYCEIDTLERELHTYGRAIAAHLNALGHRADF